MNAVPKNVSATSWRVMDHAPAFFGFLPLSRAAAVAAVDTYWRMGSSSLETRMMRAMRVLARTRRRRCRGYWRIGRTGLFYHERLEAFKRWDRARFFTNRLDGLPLRWTGGTGTWLCTPGTPGGGRHGARARTWHED